MKCGVQPLYWCYSSFVIEDDQDRILVSEWIRLVSSDTTDKANRSMGSSPKGGTKMGMGRLVTLAFAIRLLRDLRSSAELAPMLMR